MISQDIAIAASEGMNLILESFSRKGRKMPRLTIKVSDEALTKVASFEGKKKDWCSYWIVPAIPESGTFSVPAGFRFRIGHNGQKENILVQNASSTTGITLVEGDIIVMIAASFKIPNPEDDERSYFVDPGIRVVNQLYFNRWWVPAENDEEFIEAMTTKRDVLAPEFASYKNMEGLHSALESQPAKESPFDNSWTKFTVDYKNPGLEAINRMEICLRGQGRAVVDTLNPSKPMLIGLAALLRNHGFIVDETDEEWIQTSKNLLRAKGYRIYDPDAPSNEKMMVDSLRFLDYTIFEPGEFEKHEIPTTVKNAYFDEGYAAASRANHRREKIDRVLPIRAYEVGFEAGRMVERLGILNGEEKNDREERESTAEGDTRISGTFPFVGTVTGRFSSRHTEKLARHAANFRDGIASFRESESRPHQTTQWANSEQPCYSGEGESCRDEVHSSDGEATPERNENEKDNAQATDSQG